MSALQVAGGGTTSSGVFGAMGCETLTESAWAVLGGYGLIQVAGGSGFLLVFNRLR